MVPSAPPPAPTGNLSPRLGTGSGKSQFIKDLIKYKDQLFNPKINKVLYCFGEYSPAFEGMKDVEFHRGFTEELIDRSKLGVNNEQTLLILDE